MCPHHSSPIMSESWLALTTGNSLASTQTQASACPSGSLSLATQGPPGPGSRSGQSGLSSVPKPDGQSAYRIMASPGPRPPSPMVGPGSYLGNDGEAVFKPLQRPGSEQESGLKGSGRQGMRCVLATDLLCDLGQASSPLCPESRCFHWQND